MSLKVVTSGKRVARATAQLLGNNIEAYETTIPSMLSNRLRNPKFTGPENPQTGIAAEWEPAGNSMTGFSCRLVPGAYMSGREAQLIHNYTEKSWAGLLQYGVTVRSGERFEVEVWGRSQHRPTTINVELRLPGLNATPESSGQLNLDQAHWHRRTCRISSPGDGQAYFVISLPGDSRIMIDQIHLRPVGEPNVSKELIKAFDKFPCPVLRFPGGCVTNTYHWEHGIGPVHLRPVCDDPMFKYKVEYDFGTDEYLELCALKKIRPLITLNTTTATPEDAAAWAAYIRQWYIDRKLTVPAAYFLFGNENYGTWELGHMTGEMYVSQLRQFIPPVREAYPEAKVMVIGEYNSGGLREEFRTPWRSTVVEKASDLFDILAVTRYSNAKDSTDMKISMNNVADNITGKANDIAYQVQLLRNDKLKSKIAIVEWNYWTRASHNDHAHFYEPNDIRYCLYAAGFINVFCRNGNDMEVANYYSLVNTMGMIHVHDGQVELSDVTKVMNLYAPALPGEVLELSHNAPMLTEKSSALDANIIRTRKATYAFLTNFSDKAQSVTLEGIGAIKEACGISGKTIHTPVSETKPKHTAKTVTLPPMSLTRLTCANK